MQSQALAWRLGTGWQDPLHVVQQSICRNSEAVCWHGTLGRSSHVSGLKLFFHKKLKDSEGKTQNFRRAEKRAGVVVTL